MESLVLIEVLNEDEEIITSHRFDSLPITCGRGYNCDLRFDDLYICAEHFKIDKNKNGNISIKDNDSVNGIIALKSRQQVFDIEVASKELIKVGETTLRVINTKAPLAPTIPVSKFSLPVTRPRIRAHHCISAFFAFLGVYYLNTFVFGVRMGDNQNVETIVKGLISGLTFFIPWAGIWSFIGRIVIKKFRFFSHFLIISALSAVYMILAKFSSYTEFAFGSPTLGFICGVLLTWICLFAIFSLHLFYCTRLKKNRRWLFSSTIAFIIVSLFALVEFKDTLSFSTSAPISTVIKPPWARVVKGISSSDFSSKIENLRAKLELEDE